MNTPVNLELAKLLKEKGFNLEFCNVGYHGDFGDLEGDSYPFLGTYTLLKDFRVRNDDDHQIQAPNISEVIMWLYEKYGIWIGCTQLKGKKVFDCDIEGETITKMFKTPTEAYEAGIEYCLTNLK